RQDISAAEKFWRGYLKGFNAPTPLPARRGAGEGVRVSEAEVYGELNVRLAPDSTAALREMARRNGLTLNTVVEGAWALLLAHHSGAADVLFGVTVSGRPSELAGMERMIGMFVNTLPLRVKVERGAPLVAWLKELQRTQAEVGQFDYSPLVEVQGWGDVPRTARLFETLITFQNVPALDPAAVADAPREGELQISSETSTKTHYPLTLLVEPAAELALRILYDRRLFEPEDVARVWRHLETLLMQMGAHPRATLETLEAALPESDRSERLRGERNRERAHLSKLRTIKPRAVNLPDAE
ncbi:MAG: condensation domain-containing protein, partial [Pyrinomonadaceae bacterium]